MKDRQMKFFIHFLFPFTVIISISLNSSCSSSQKILKSDYYLLQSDSHATYRIETIDGIKYEFEQFTIDNDTLRIRPKKFLFYKETEKVIALKNIKYILRVKKEKPLNVLLITFLSIFTVLSILYFIGMSSIGEGLR